MAVVAPLRERRFYPRISCEVLDSKKQCIRNVSQNGLYLESHKEYPNGSEIPISFFVPPEDIPLRLKAQVMRRENLRSGKFGYGLCLKGLSAEDFKQLQHYYFYQSTQRDTPKVRGEPEGHAWKVLYKTISIQTQQQNLAILDPRLSSFLQPSDFFYIHDLTKEIQAFVDKSGVSQGQLLAQILHTSATLCVNELDEPMLLMDIARKMRTFVPKEGEYLHNSSLREVNLCPDDSHCDRNGDAHVKAILFGHPSVTLIIRDGRLVLGQWQKVALVEFDGPRRREVLVQVVGL